MLNCIVKEGLALEYRLYIFLEIIYQKEDIAKIISGKKPPPGLELVPINEAEECSWTGEWNVYSENNYKY